MLHTSMTMNKFFVNFDSLVNVSRKVSFSFQILLHIIKLPADLD